MDETKQSMRDKCKWRDIGDVDWDDLSFYLDKAKRINDKESFDTAIRVLAALKAQSERK